MCVKHYYEEIGFPIQAVGFNTFSATIGAELPGGYLVTSVGFDWAPLNAAHRFTPTRVRAVDLGQIALVAGWVDGPGTLYMEIVLSSGVGNVVGN